MHSPMLLGTCFNMDIYEALAKIMDKSLVDGDLVIKMDETQAKKFLEILGL